MKNYEISQDRHICSKFGGILSNYEVEEFTDILDNFKLKPADIFIYSTTNFLSCEGMRY